MACIELACMVGASVEAVPIAPIGSALHAMMGGMCMCLLGAGLVLGLHTKCVSSWCGCLLRMCVYLRSPDLRCHGSRTDCSVLAGVGASWAASAMRGLPALPPRKRNQSGVEDPGTGSTGSNGHSQAVGSANHVDGTAQRALTASSEIQAFVQNPELLQQTLQQQPALAALIGADRQNQLVRALEAVGSAGGLRCVPYGMQASGQCPM